MPDGNIHQNQPVTITVNTTDTTAGIKDIRLAYDVNNSTTMPDMLMTLNQTTYLYEYTINGQQESTITEYRMTAHDNAGNQITQGDSHRYSAIPESFNH